MVGGSIEVMQIPYPVAMRNRPFLVLFVNLPSSWRVGKKRLLKGISTLERQERKISVRSRTDRKKGKTGKLMTSHCLFPHTMLLEYLTQDERNERSKIRKQTLTSRRNKRKVDNEKANELFAIYLDWQRHWTEPLNIYRNKDGYR